VALSHGDLPALASALGMVQHHFSVALKKSWPWGKALAIGAGLVCLISIWMVRQNSERAAAYLKHRRELLSNIYATKDGHIHRRLRDECLKEFILLERQENGQKTLQNSGQREAQEERIDLKEVLLYQADLHRCDLSRVNFLNAELSEANLNRTDLQGSYCKRVQFQKAHLYMANFSFSVLSHANFEGAKLSGTNFTGTVGLELAKFNEAEYDERTIWPEGWGLKELSAKGAIFTETKETPVFNGPDDNTSRRRGIK
jgi:uncharacterized protein YjbI with pentapeptide repeats